MALLGNYSVYLKNPATYIGSTQVSNVRSAFNSTGQNRQRYYADTAEGLPLTASLATGTEPPYSVLIPYKGGELSSTTGASGNGGLSGSMILTKPLSADLAGVGGLQGSLGLLSNMAASLAGVGAISGSLSQLLSLSASLSGTGNISASLGLIVGMLSNMSGSGSVSGNLTGVARLEAIIYVNQSEAEVKQIKDAIWNAIASEYNLSGTMGQKLNGAGSAGDPWTTDLSTYNTEATAGKILKDAADAAELASIK